VGRLEKCRFVVSTFLLEIANIFPNQMAGGLDANLQQVKNIFDFG
jgi:hypothetical protein